MTMYHQVWGARSANNAKVKEFIKQGWVFKFSYFHNEDKQWVAYLEK
jgi:hypothetical protein